MSEVVNIMMMMVTVSMYFMEIEIWPVFKLNYVTSTNNNNTRIYYFLKYKNTIYIFRLRHDIIGLDFEMLIYDNIIFSRSKSELNNLFSTKQ